MPSVIDLFAGAGGFSLGFKLAGFKIISAVENFKPKAKTYSFNFPEVKVYVSDIKALNPKDFPKADVIIGGPPCEPFTAINSRRMENPKDRLYRDPIGRLVLEFIRFVKEIKPKVFVMENVPQIMELEDYLIREFDKAGYPIEFNILNALDYGVPQIRRRVFISNVKIRPDKVKGPKKVWDVLKDVPFDAPNNELFNPPSKVARKIPYLKWGEGAQRFGRFMNWVRLHPYKSAPTVRGSSRFVHPFENRPLTVREQARIMGFPDDFVFLGGRNIQFDSVGEAVPPPLARSIAEFLLRTISWE
ncbi:DNA cytosine methyltransferase [Pyrococcus furiosus DSM 3638]|uniref:DNA (cytosine-5-)-methyltransferase n=3 Tax=Pyrococcus furiosus TaxID=2261 RepID=Q8U4N2_PYRFU|nr:MULTISPECIES: DNA cytosine methyltransferase [Pyrococcus]AAL80173.1 site-specific DNA-methyltransferase (cytosine-specific) [Pyrococcus furiosus DSM 3638]AFN04524.1 cytosine-specific DNA-methyltransferase [Pyrococcus furiosus COM1]MDK2869192.1 (cytosine-5)-methyltransferase 1 [Pyrococcus sp.]QEK77784.1 DNA cytosine methyltransferase [Pyrococcus furiosus DSM 3638]